MPVPTEKYITLSVPIMWCTYVLLSEESYQRLKAKLDRAPWHYGITYQRKITEDFLDVTNREFREKWGAPYYKIGDDFSHLSDVTRSDMYDREFMERHIKEVIDYLAGEINETRT